IIFLNLLLVKPTKGVGYYFFGSFMFFYPPQLISFLMIFLARTFDVSLGTVRVMLTAKGYKHIVPIIAFVEILIWLMAMGFVMENLDKVENVLGYALGFAMGNYVGMWMEEKIAIGYLSIRLITKRDSKVLIKTLRENGFGFIQNKATGNSGKISVVYCTIKRSHFDKWLEIVKTFNPGAFYTVADVRSVKSDVFSIERPALNIPKVRI
ncbi:MAG: DUF5698 domain-containing protein, partial [Candidatus Pacebacteria bacterium]|nr:DUF5698 domain-containing protein [Candidatus Paceibacterota bacterium]